MWTLWQGICTQTTTGLAHETAQRWQGVSEEKQKSLQAINYINYSIFILILSLFHSSFICYENCDDGCAASFINYFLLKKHIEEEHSSATWTEESGKKSRFQEKRKRKATEASSSSCSGGSKRKKREIVVVENNSGEVEFILGELVNNESQDAMSNDQESQDDDNRTPDEEEQDDEEEILKAFEEEDLMDYEANEWKMFSNFFVMEEINFVYSCYRNIMFPYKNWVIYGIELLCILLKILKVIIAVYLKEFFYNNKQIITVNDFWNNYCFAWYFLQPSLVFKTFKVLRFRYYNLV